MNFKQITKTIQERKTTYAYDFSDRKIEKETIEAIVTNALWAPTHKLTQPWRFVVLEGKHREALGEFMANYYRKIYSEEEFSNERYKETKRYASKASMIGVIFKPSKRAQLPEWEEIAAISSAVQNMWLSCTSLNLGSYWDTSMATIKYGEKEISLEENEQFLGVFFIGHVKENLPKVNRKRKPLSKKLSWHFKE